MPKCPYCKNKLEIEDFFTISTWETKRGKIKHRIESFNGQELEIGYKNEVKMWACPFCDTIIGFSEHKYDAKI